MDTANDFRFMLCRHWRLDSAWIAGPIVMFKHEDNRRILIEWATGSFKECKVAIMKQDGVLGDHWHANKDEQFLLLQGRASKIVIGNRTWTAEPACSEVFFVPRNTYHAFHLDRGSVLLGAATELYDKDDERTDKQPEWEVRDGYAVHVASGDRHALKETK